MSIYMIRSKEPSLHDFYIGSCEDMRQRMNGHKSRCYNENFKEYNKKLYQHIRANGGWDNFIMEQIDTCDVERLFIVEQEYIDKLFPSLNERRAYRSEEYVKEYHKEYRENNGDIIREKIKEHYEKNKDIICERRKEKFTCECGGKYTRTHKSEHMKSNKHKSYIALND